VIPVADIEEQLQTLAARWAEHRKTCADPGCDVAHENHIDDIGEVLAAAAKDRDAEHLGVLTDKLLALSMPGPAFGPDRARWERGSRGVVARIFRLGMTAGWDKAVAAGEQAALDIRAAETERIARLAEAGGVLVYVDEDNSGIAVGVPFADVIRREADDGT
jgi:hypothetical protein